MIFCTSCINCALVADRELTIDMRIVLLFALFNDDKNLRMMVSDILDAVIFSASELLSQQIVVAIYKHFKKVVVIIFCL